MRPFQLVIFLFCASSWVTITFAQTEVEKLVAASNPIIQTQIGATVRAFLSGSRSEIKTNWKGFRELAKLEELAEDKEEIVKQLVIYAVVERHDEDQQVLESLLILQLLDLKPSIAIRVLAPYLDTENKLLGEFVQDWFESRDDREIGGLSRRMVYFQDYLDYVCGSRNTNQQIPTAFIKYLYERSPDQALMVFYRTAQQDGLIARLMEMRKNHEAHQREREKDGRNDELAASLAEWSKEMAALQGKDAVPVPPIPPMPPPVTNLPDMITRPLEKRPQKEILLAEHLVSNVIWLKKNKFDNRFQKALPEAKEELSKLAEYDQWWVRLYVTEIMRRHRELRQADVLEKLSRDGNALVSKLAKSLIESN